VLVQIFLLIFLSLDVIRYVHSTLVDVFPFNMFENLPEFLVIQPFCFFPKEGHLTPSAKSFLMITF